MARDGGRERGAATRGRGRPRKNTGIPLNLDPEPRPATSTPTTTTTTATHTTTPPIVATSGPSAGLPHMVMILTPGSRVQSSETGGPGPVKKGTTEITNEFKEHYKWYAPLFSQAPDEAIDFWWEEWRKRFRFRRGDEANMRKAWESRVAKRHQGLMHNIRE
ncbi:hypothetical protein PIB30_030933 [Stylosanthes scabra]|uniref:Uncharacterized protein n=1 Tax=Stylosanthes scabra TaxID=79078 RepID=A0ABU6QBC6_9FABA|nr:hypothetical protein [Stylosanthes scabra]